MSQNKSSTYLCKCRMKPSAQLASHSAHVLRPCPSNLGRKNNWGIFHWKDAAVETKAQLGLFYFPLSSPTRSVMTKSQRRLPSDLARCVKANVLWLYSGTVNVFPGNEWTRHWTNAGFLSLFLSLFSQVFCFLIVFYCISLYLFVYHFIPRCSLLLYYPPSPLPPSFLSGCRVMYGPRQPWDQWDASCFNLAPEPGKSRSGASQKSDGTGLSPPLCTPLPPHCSSMLHWSTLCSCWKIICSRSHHLETSERRRANLLADWGCSAPLLGPQNQIGHHRYNMPPNE